MGAFRRRDHRKGTGPPSELASEMLANLNAGQVDVDRLTDGWPTNRKEYGRPEVNIQGKVMFRGEREWVKGRVICAVSPPSPFVARVYPNFSFRVEVPKRSLCWVQLSHVPILGVHVEQDHAVYRICMKAVEGEVGSDFSRWVPDAPLIDFLFDTASDEVPLLKAFFRGIERLLDDANPEGWNKIACPDW